MSIIYYIPRGKKNAQTAKQLCDITTLSPRQLRKEIERERIKGTVILSSAAGGYWLPSFEDEDLKEQLEHFISFMFGRNPFQTVKSAQKLLKLIENGDQLTIENY